MAGDGGPYRVAVAEGAPAASRPVLTPEHLFLAAVVTAKVFAQIKHPDPQVAFGAGEAIVMVVLGLAGGLGAGLATDALFDSALWAWIVGGSTGLAGAFGGLYLWDRIVHWRVGSKLEPAARAGQAAEFDASFRFFLSRLQGRGALSEASIKMVLAELESGGVISGRNAFCASLLRSASRVRVEDPGTATVPGAESNAEALAELPGGAAQKPR